MKLWRFNSIYSRTVQVLALSFNIMLLYTSTPLQQYFLLLYIYLTGEGSYFADKVCNDVDDIM